LRNDLTPAAVSLAAELADWMGELARSWGRPVLMSGSGPSLFSFFLDSDEAESAVATVEGHRGAAAADPRRQGVERVG
jgi:4-diphosphocytidyl-2C-methyl-D-erythritol kinase